MIQIESRVIRAEGGLVRNFEVTGNTIYNVDGVSSAVDQYLT